MDEKWRVLFRNSNFNDLDRIRAVAERVKTEVEAGNQVAVVVSAMSGTTNQLVEWAGYRPAS